MSEPCGYDGDAHVHIRYGIPEWVRTDERIHVSEQVLDSRDGARFLATKYVVGDWCESFRAWHATLKPEEDQ